MKVLVTWEAIAKRREREVEMFERKFIDYRNKMLEIHGSLLDDNPIKKEIEKFVQDEQDDVTFNA
ncbi:hypothetical protein [Cytobacillus oceanisediminis]|uniref:hypothetical protein n=1 Tax=Cytobacillus oceanisediminis TaxID=665099 RepID=UPI002040EA30|nr:hypothetical protein [Cytobacillus oceanisediminis]MCM3400959.1 hypothetical protein [Cytobacillus oceanisediminis]